MTLAISEDSQAENTVVESAPIDVEPTVQEQMTGRMDDLAEIRDASVLAHWLEEALAAKWDDEELLPFVERLSSHCETELQDVSSAERLWAQVERVRDHATLYTRRRAELWARVGRAHESLRLLQECVPKIHDRNELAEVHECAGDLCRDMLLRPQDALLHYRSAVQSAPHHVSALRKARDICLEAEQWLQVKELTDLEAEALSHHMPRPPEWVQLVSDAYATIVKALIPQAKYHEVAFDALDRLREWDGDGDRFAELDKTLSTLPENWREQIRGLRELSIKSNDKRESAKHYLTIAQLIYGFEPDNIEEIEKNIDKALLLFPGHRPTLRFMEQIARETDRLGLFLEKLQNLCGEVRSTKLKVDLGLYATILMAELGADVDELIEAYSDVLDRDPRNSSAHFALTELYLNAGDFETAVECMEAFLDSTADPDVQRTTLRELVRILEHELHEPARAAKQLERLHALDSSDEILLHLAALYEELDDDKSLSDVLAQLCKTSAAKRYVPGGETGVLQRLWELYQQEPEASNEAFDVLCRLVISSSDRALEDELVRLAKELSAHLRAGEALEQSASQQEQLEEQRRLVFQAAVQFRKADAPNRVRELLSQWLKNHPDDADALEQIESVLPETTRPEDHAKLLEAKLDASLKDEERLETLLRLADVYHRLQRSADVESCLRRILDIQDDHLEAMLMLETHFREHENWPAQVELMPRLVELLRKYQRLEECFQTQINWAQTLEERLDRSDEAADIYLELLNDERSTPEVFRRLELLLTRGIRVVQIAEVCAPVYASRKEWPRHVEMLGHMRDGAVSNEARAELSRQIASLAEHQLRNPRAAFGAWCDALRNAPRLPSDLQQAERLAERLGAHAHLARVLEHAAEACDVPAEKARIEKKREALVQGVLEEQSVAIQQCVAKLKESPDHLPSLDSLISLYEKQEAWTELEEVLARRLEQASSDEKSSLAAKLGRLRCQMLDDTLGAREAFQIAFSGDVSQLGPQRMETTRLYVQVMTSIHQESKDMKDAEVLADTLSALASLLAGRERADVRARLGDFLRTEMGQAGRALAAYEAATANDPEHGGAEAGIRGLLEGDDVEISVRRAAARLLGGRYRSTGNLPGLAYVLQVQTSFEDSPAQRRQLNRELARMFAEELDDVEEAISILLEHVSQDPTDGVSRQEVESLAGTHGFGLEVLNAWRELRAHADPELSKLYAERTVAMAERLQDDEHLAEALDHIANKGEHSVRLLERLRVVKSRLGDHEGVADCLERLAVSEEKKVRIERLLVLSDYCFEVLHDAERGLQALRACRELMPDDDAILFRMHKRLTEGQEYSEWAEVVRVRAERSGSATEKANLWLELATLQLEKLSQADNAVEALKQSLLVLQDGHTSARAVDLLQQIARRGDGSAQPAMRTLVAHYRAGETWQPLNEALELLAHAINDTEERAAIFDEMCRLHTEKLQNPSLAFRDASRAFREAPNAERLTTLRALADTAGEAEEFFSVVEGVAAILVQQDDASRDFAISMYREIQEGLRVGESDSDVIRRISTSILHFVPNDLKSFELLENALRAQDQREDLIALFERRLAYVDNAPERQRLLFELGMLRSDGEDPEAAEASLRELVEEDDTNESAWAALDALYERTGNTAEQVRVIEKRIALVEELSEKAVLYVRLSNLYLTYRGDPISAYESISQAVELMPQSDEVRGGVSALLQHAQHHGTPPLGSVASLLASVLRAQEDWEALPATVEIRLRGESDPAERASRMMEVSEVYEAKLQQLELAFMWAGNAFSETPADEAIRSELERLAVATENQDALYEVYSDASDAIDEPQLSIVLNRRLASLADEVLHEPQEAMKHLQAAMNAGDRSFETLQRLVQLSRESGDLREHARVMQVFAEVTSEHGDVAVFKDAYAELADVYEELGELVNAISAAREVTELDPEDAVAQSSLQRLLSQAAQWEDLESALRDILKRATQPGEKMQTLLRLLEVQLRELRSYDKALESLNALVELSSEHRSIVPLAEEMTSRMEELGSPEHRSHLARLGQILQPHYEQNGEWEAVIASLRHQANDVDDRDEQQQLRLQMAELYEEKLGQPQLAFIEVGKALMAAPDDRFLFDRAEHLCRELQDVETLLGLFEDIAETLDADIPLRIRYLIRCAELADGRMDAPAEAAKYFEQAVRLMQRAELSASELHKPLERLERLLRGIGDPERLAWVLKTRASLSEGDAVLRSKKRFEAAHIELQVLEDFAAAVTTFQEILEEDAANRLALRGLADACAQQERWEESVEARLRELSLLEEKEIDRQVEIRFEVGRIYAEHLAQLESANDQFRKILEVAPQHAKTRQYLEERMTRVEKDSNQQAAFLQRSYEQTGDWHKAIDVLRRRLSLAEEKQAAAECSSLLREIAELQIHKLKQPTLAFGTLCSALKYDPSEPRLRDQLRVLATEQELQEELCDVYDEEIAAAQETGRESLAAELREQLADFQASALGNLDAAITLYEEVLAQAPGRSTPLVALTRLYEDAARWEDFERILRRRLMFLDDNEERNELLFPLGQALADELDRPEEAIPMLEEIRNTEPAHAAARRLLIELYDGAEELERLRDLLQEEMQACEKENDAPGFSQARRRLAFLLTEQLDIATDAATLWESIYETDGTDAAAFAALESLYPRLGRWDDLRTLYEESLRRLRDPNAIAEITLKLGRILDENLDDPEAAVARHLKALELSPRNEDSLRSLRVLYRKLERWEDLVALIRRMMRLQHDAGQLKELRFELAETLVEHLGKRAESIETGRRILDIEPHSSGDFGRLEVIFRKNGAYDELAHTLGQHADTESGPVRAELLLELSETLQFRLERTDDAANALSLILQDDPRHEVAYENLCAIWEKNENWPALVKLKESRLSVQEEEGETLSLLREIGQIYEERLEQKEMAFLAACRAYREDFDDTNAAQWMDRLALATDSVEELIAVYDDALEHLQDETRIIDTHLRIAELAWVQLKDSDAAELHLKRVIEHQADHEQALERLSALYIDLSRWPEVVALYERKFDMVSEVSDKHAILRHIAALFENNIEDVDGAVAAYKRMLDLEPGNLHVVREFGEMLERAGRWQTLIGVLAKEEDLVEAPAEKIKVRYRAAEVWEQEINEPRHAVEIHHSILNDDPEYLPSLKALERLHTNLGHGDALVEVFEQMLAFSESDEEKVLLLSKIAATWEANFDNAEKAIEANVRLLQLDPANLLAVKAQERLYRKVEAWENVVDMLERHISLTAEVGELVELHLQLGDVLQQQLGAPERAEASFRKSLELDPGSKRSLHALGALYEHEQKWDQALERLTQEVQLAGTSQDAVELHFRIGKIQEEKLGDVDAAVEQFHSALDIEPGHLPSIQSLKALAQTAENHEDYLQWLRTEAAYTKAESERTALHTAAGRFLLDVVLEESEAAEEFERALSIEPNHLDAIAPLAELCFRAGRWERCEQLLKLLVVAQEDSPPAEKVRPTYRLGYVSEKLGKHDDSLSYYRQAYNIDGKYLPVLEGFAAALAQAEEWDEASTVLQAILIHHREELSDGEVVGYFTQLGNLQQQMGESEKAVKTLQKATEIDPCHVDALRLLVDLHREAERFEDAYDCAMALEPLLAPGPRVTLLSEVGELCSLSLDDPYRAIDAYEDALRLQPENQSVLDGLFELYRKTRQGARAAETLQTRIRIENDVNQRVTLHHTLGEVLRDDLRQVESAVAQFNAALDESPTHIRSFQAAEELLGQVQDWSGLETLYLAMIKRLSQGQEALKRELWRNLAGLYRHRLRNVEAAAQAYGVLHKLEPENVETLQVLGDLQARIPNRVPEAIGSFQKWLVLAHERPQMPLHGLVRLYHHQKQYDRAYICCAALRVLGDIKPEEAQLHDQLQAQAVFEPRSALTPKLWEALLLHPQARGHFAELSALLWRAAANTLAQSPRALGLDKKKLWKQESLDAAVPTFFVTQLKRVRAALGVGNFDLYMRKQSADPLVLLPLERPSLGVGEGNEVFREMPDRQLRFLCARQVAHMRTEFLLPCVLGAAGFQACVDAAIRVVEPRYMPLGDPRQVAGFDKFFARFGPQLKGALRGPVLALLASGVQVNTQVFLEGMELTALRAAYAVTGDLALSVQLLRQPDPGPLPVSFGRKLQDLLGFSTSEAHFELRERLGMAIGL